MFLFHCWDEYQVGPGGNFGFYFQNFISLDSTSHRLNGRKPWISHESNFVSHLGGVSAAFNYRGELEKNTENFCCCCCCLLSILLSSVSWKFQDNCRVTKQPNEQHGRQEMAKLPPRARSVRAPFTGIYIKLQTHKKQQNNNFPLIMARFRLLNWKNVENCQLPGFLCSLKYANFTRGSAPFLISAPKKKRIHTTAQQPIVKWTVM